MPLSSDTWDRFIRFTAVLLIGCLCPTVSAQQVTGGEADFTKAVIAARSLCSSTPNIQSSQLCEAIVNADTSLQNSIDIASTDAVRLRILSSLTSYLGSASAGDTIAKLTQLGRQLSAGDLKSLANLNVVPTAFCTDLKIDEGFCRLPACFLSASKETECPKTPLALNEQTLKKSADEWIRAHRAKFNPCPATEQPCIPADRVAVAARSILAANGAGIVASLSTLIASSSPMPDAPRLGQAVLSELTCLADRSLALQIATNIPSTDIGPVLAPFIAKGTKPDEILATMRRLRQSPCNGAATDRLFTATVALLANSQNTLVAALAAAGSPGSISQETTETTRAVPPTAGKLNIDIPITGSDFIRGVRVHLDRRSPEDKSPVTGRLSLLLDETNRASSRSGAPSNSVAACCEGSREIDLKIRLANLLVKGEKVSLEGPLGLDTYAVDESKFAYAVQEFAGVPLLSFRVTNIALSREILPISFNAKATLPGLPSTLDLGTITLSATGVSASLRQLIDRKALLDRLSAALRNLGPVSLKAPVLGNFSLDQISVHLDDQGPNKFRYDALFRNALVDTLTDKEGIPALISVSSDGAITADASIPSAKALSKLNDILTRAATSLLPQELQSKLLSGDSWVRIQTPMLRDGAVSFSVVFAPPGVPPLDPIAISLRSAGDDVVRQVTGQLAGQANRLNALFNSYAETVLKREGEDWLKNQARFSEAALRASLAQGVSLFGMQLRVTDIKTESGRLSVTVKSTGNNGQPLFEVKGIRIGELDATGHPVISAQSLEHAVIQGDFTGWIDRTLPGSEYVKLRITSAYFGTDGGLRLGGTVLIPALGDPFSVNIGPISSSDSPIKVGNIKPLLLARALSEANARCKGCHIDVGSLTLTVSGFRAGSGDDLILDGSFTFRDLVSGTAQVNIYPQLKVLEVKPSAPSTKLFGDLLHLPIGGITLPAIESLDPLAFSVAVDLSDSGFPFKFPQGVALPVITVRIPASGDIQVTEPISIKIPGDFPIAPPAFILTNAQVDLFPKSMWRFGASGDLTVANGTLAGVARIAARIEGDLQKFDFQFNGPLYLARTVQLMETTGHINIPAQLAEASSKTSGIVRQIVMSDGQMTINGKTCSFQDRMDLQFLGASLRGTLGIQLRGCSSDAGVCNVRSGAPGAVCAAGQVNLGPLGSAEGSAEFSLDLHLPVVSAQVQHVTPFDVGVGVRASENFAKASFNALGFEFALITPSVATLTPDLIRQLIEEALKLNISLDALLNRKITLSLLPSSSGSDGDPQPPSGGAQGTGGEPGTGADAGGASGGGASDNGPAGRPLPGTESTGGGAPPPPPGGGGLAPANPSTGGGGGTSEQSPWAPGDYSVSFEASPTNAQLFLRHFLLKGVVVSTDDWWFHASKVEVLKDSKAFSYPDLVRSKTATAQDRNGANRPREYQLFATPPGGQHACQSGVCSMRLGPEDDGKDTLRDLAGTGYLQLVFGGTSTPYEGFRTLTPYARPAQFGALSDLAQASWEPQTFGAVTNIACVTNEIPCTRFAVTLNRGGEAVTIVHSDKSALSGSHFDRSLTVSPNSLLSGTLNSPDRSPWVLDVMDRVSPVVVLQSDADSFLIRVPNDFKVDAPMKSLNVFTPGKGLGHLVQLAGDFELRGTGPGGTLPVKPKGNATYRQIHALLKARQSSSQSPPAILTFGGRKEGWVVAYRETGTSADAVFAIITGNYQQTCLRHATVGDIARKWSQWHGAKEAPDADADYSQMTARLQRLMLDAKQTWRQEGFARNPLLLLTAQTFGESVCSN